MKKIIFIILIFTTYYSVAQKNQGVISYEKELIQNKEKLNTLKSKKPALYSKMKKIETNSMLILKDLRFLLIFKKEEGLFKVKEFLELENKPSYGFAIGPYGSGIYYNNLSNKVYYAELEAFGESFLIKTPNPKWKTHNITKKIGDYICYKATTITEVKGRKGIIKYPVTAWYAPKLPFSFGPLGYNGLPGLILELEFNNERYTATKINLNPKKKVKIEKPKKGKEVTKEEFEEIGLKTMNEFRKTIKN